MRTRSKVVLTLTLVTLLEMGIFSHYNTVLGGRHTHTPSPSSVNVVSVGALDLPQNNPMLAITDDQQELAYIDESHVLRVEDLSTRKGTFHLQLKFTPVYLTWIGDHRLFIGTQYNTGATKALRLSTIDTQSGTVRLVQEFDGFALDAYFKQVAYSNYTNDVYVLIGSSSGSVLYHFDTNGNMNTVDDGGRFLSNIGVSQTGDVLFFQDFAEGTPNILKENSSGNIQLIQRNAFLLRVVNNTLYFARLNTQGDALSAEAYDGKRIRTIATLSEPITPHDVFVTSSGLVYLLSPAGILNVKGAVLKTIPTEGTISVSGNAFFVISSGNVEVGA